jgi:hypothetical protein
MLWTATSSRREGPWLGSTSARASRAAEAARPPPAVAAALRARLETPSALAAQAASPRPEAPAAPPSATRTPPQAEAGVEAANFSRMARLEPKP